MKLEEILEGREATHVINQNRIAEKIMQKMELGSVIQKTRNLLS